MFTPASMDNSKRSDSAGRKGMILLSIFIFTLLCYRITVGVDLTDESYYLSFLDGWLKTGVYTSNTLVLHQTAELMIFPLIKAFAAIQPDAQGLALYNRLIYLCGNAISGYLFFRFARTRQTFTVSMLCGITVMSFIPFSLPAPSYNTMGMLGMVCAVSTFGVFHDNHKIRWLVFSALGWMVSVIAYPTFALVLASFILSVMMVPTLKQNSRRYIAWCMAFQIVGLVLLLCSYGFERLIQIFNFTNASLQVANGLGGKLVKAITLITSNHIFFTLCIMSIITGTHAGLSPSRSISRWTTVIAVVAILVTAGVNGPWLYATSHDFIFLLSMMGVAYSLTHALTKRDPDTEMTAYFFVSVVAGIVTSLTATNSIVNFAIGGFLSVCVLLLAIFPKEETAQRPHSILISAVVALMLVCNFGFVYGESVNPLRSNATTRVRLGVFAGLLTTTEKAQAISQTAKFLESVPGESVAVLGRLPSIYLLTRMRPKAPSTWDFSQQNGATSKIDAAISEFYGRESNVPTVLLKVTDPWTVAPSESGKRLQDRYMPLSSLDTKMWKVEVFVQPADTR